LFYVFLHLRGLSAASANLRVLVLLLLAFKGALEELI
jgi:hypothetical protein